MGRLIKPEVSIEEALKEPEKWIPEGCYCHGCPFWEHIPDREPMENGWCRYLNKGDLEFYEEDNWLSLLWDQCKECGVNDEDWMYGTN